MMRGFAGSNGFFVWMGGVPGSFHMDAILEVRSSTKSGAGARFRVVNGMRTSSKLRRATSLIYCPYEPIALARSPTMRSWTQQRQILKSWPFHWSLLV